SLQPAPGALSGALLGLARRQPGDTGEGPLRPLLRADNLAFELARQGRRWQFAARPGSVDLLGAPLRWRAAAWDSGDATTPPRLELDAEIEPVRVADWLRRIQPDFGWGGDLRVGASARIRSEPAVSARIEIARAGGDLEVNEFGVVQTLGLSEARLAFSADAGSWRLSQQITGRTLGRIDGEQTLRTDPQRLWPDADAPIEGRLGARVENLGTWGAWVPAGWRLAGQLDAALQIAGRFGAPTLTGEVTGRDIGLRNALEGVALSDGRIDARFEGETARLGTLRFKAGDGSIAISGDAQLGAEPRLELKLEADRATVLGRVDRRVVASGQATLQADRRRLAITGQVRADEGLIDISRSDAPRLGDDVSVRRRGDRPPPEPTPAEAEKRAPRAVEADLRVDLGPHFALRGRGIDTRLGGELRFTTPGGRLTTRGEIRTERGTYEAYGQKLEIERGVITFVGPVDNPRLDIEAVRPNTDVRVGVRVGGSAQAPRVRLFSEPDLPATEKLALLVTGRSYDSLGGADTLLLQRAAFALLAGDGSGAADFNVARALQLDELSVRQSDGVVRDTVVTLGKQISDRVFLGYERGMDAAAGNWQLIYRIAQRFTLRAQSGDDSALDLIWLFRW
ncbi:MAG TPA: translocation/assembly module TamB domain-containing protein, partial [Methylibium sp.]|nr:translocation/assembly module TamB domain-containing protein [Methylibium sp.]